MPYLGLMKGSEMTKVSGLLQQGFASGFPVSEFGHHQTHLGKLWTLGSIVEGLADNASVEMLIRVPVGIILHVAFEGTSGGHSYGRLFEGPTTTADGTAQTPINKNRLFRASLPNSQFFAGPTVTVDGDQLFESFFPGGTKAKAPGAEGDFPFWLLDEGDYLARFTNKAQAVATMGLLLTIHETS